MSTHTLRLRVFCILAVLALSACGGSDHGRTAYGSATEVRDYRDQIDAVVDIVNRVQEAIEAEAVGSSGQATGENLSLAYARLRPQLQAALERLRSIEPPTALRQLHARMEQVLMLRLQAFAQVDSGWTLEQAQSFAAAAPLYDAAEDKLDTAAELARAVNDELAAVDVALAEAERREVLACGAVPAYGGPGVRRLSA